MLAYLKPLKQWKTQFLQLWKQQYWQFLSSTLYLGVQVKWCSHLWIICKSYTCSPYGTFSFQVIIMHFLTRWMLLTLMFPKCWTSNTSKSIKVESTLFSLMNLKLNTQQSLILITLTSNTLMLQLSWIQKTSILKLLLLSLLV